MVILIYACTAMANGAWCSTHHLPIMAVDPSPMRCMLAQPILARWSAEHPEWAIERWECQAVRFAEAIR